MNPYAWPKPILRNRKPIYASQAPTASDDLPGIRQRTGAHRGTPGGGWKEAGIYTSQEDFVRDIVKEMAMHRIKTYEKAVNRYRAKYGTLQRFGAKIKGKATPKQEDESMEWEAAEGMLAAWKKVAKSSV